MRVSRVLLISIALVWREAHAQTGSSPPPKTIVDLIKEQTFQHHAGREASAVDNSTDAIQDLAPLNFAPVGGPATGGPSPTAELVSIQTGQKNSDQQTSQAATSPMQYDVFLVDGDAVVVPKTSQTSYRESWALPAAVVLLLVTAAGVGFFVVYRRRRASRYHGLNETELGQQRG